MREGAALHKRPKYNMLGIESICTKPLRKAEKLTGVTAKPDYRFFRQSKASVQTQKDIGGGLRPQLLA